MHAKNSGEPRQSLVADFAFPAFKQGKEPARDTGFFADLLARLARPIDDVLNVHAQNFTLCEIWWQA